MDLMGQQVSWVGESLEGDFPRWWRSGATKALWAIPLIISWGVWLARNDVIFNDLIKVPTEIAIKAMGIAKHYVQLNSDLKTRNILQEQINLEMPWGYFDGAVEGNPSLCGGGVVLFFNLQNHITFKEGLGEGTNNFAELCALILLLTTSLEWGVRTLQMFGDSKIIINWENWFLRCHNFRLIPLSEDILVLKQQFDFLSITHVF